MRFAVRYGVGGEYTEEFHEAADAFDFASQLAVSRIPGWIDPMVEEVIVGQPYRGRVSEHG